MNHQHMPATLSQTSPYLEEKSVFSNANVPRRSLQDYIYILMKRRWLVLTVFLAIVVTAVLYSFTATPIYKANTQLLIERDTPRVLDVRDIMPASGEEFYQTQYKLLESRALARRVMEKLQLKENDRFSPIFDQLPEDADPVEVQRAEERLMGSLLLKMEVIPIRNSRLVDVSIFDSDPLFAARLANTFAQSYMDHALDMRYSAAQETSRWLQLKIKEAREKLEESETMLNEYKKDKDITAPEDKENITAQKLEQLNRELVTAQTRRLEAETRYIQGNRENNLPEILNSPVIQSLRASEAKLFGDRSELAQKFGDQHPRLLMLDQQLAAIRSTIQAEIKRVVHSIKNQYQVAREHEEKLKNALEEQKIASQEMSDRGIQYQVLWRGRTDQSRPL